MQKYKVYVYAICKNEEKYVKRWVESMSEADGIYVLDTGSTDKTVELLNDSGVKVKCKKVVPWRFDVARNLSLDMVPEDADICVCTDLDELFHQGWREKMEKTWTKETKRLKYRYTWNFNEDGSEGCVFWIGKAHSRNDFRWINPVHEVLKYLSETPYKETAVYGVQLDHHADNTKSRGQYLKLLELAVKENPDDDRNMHYLGREYMFNGMWDKCRKTLIKHLEMPSATWRDERCASMRFLARACYNLGMQDEQQQWIFRAIAEAPYMREPWLLASMVAAQKKEWAGSLYFAEKALEIKERSMSYINEAESWGARPYDLAAIASYYLGLYEKAFDYGKKAVEAEPDNKRIADNFKFYKDALIQKQNITV